MKIKKTPTDKRRTYKLYDENGRFVTEYKPGVDGVTEIDILNMHRLDDHEVYVNSKELKLPEWYQPIYNTWKEKFITDFIEKNGREPRADEIPGRHRVIESVDFIVYEGDGELGDKSRLQEELAVNCFEEDEPSLAVIRLKEIIGGLSKKKQQVYELVIIGGLSNKDAGKKLSITGQRVSQIVKEITDEISSDKNLKKFFE